MTAHFPDYDTVCAALTLANRAPSVHNSQPWQWRVGPHSLHLYAQSPSSLPHTDRVGRDLMVGCGAALYHCAIALAALGWRAVIHRFPDPARPEHLASLEVHREQPTEVDIALAAAIPRRRTDRRHYSAWPVALGDVAMMGARAARLGVTMRRLETTADFGVRLVRPADLKTDRDNGILLALGTADDGDPARLRAGEATSAVLLTATAKGLASCQVTDVLEVADTRRALRRSAFCDGQVPQMLVRVGWAPFNADPLPAAPRRSLTDSVSRLDGSAFL